MSVLSEWLKSLGLERYAGAFESAEIDPETLPELTDDDLRDMGLPLGPRRKVLAALRGDYGALPAAKFAPAAPAREAASHGERRHITVLFADMVGSTDIASHVDPEAMSELLRTYQRIVSEKIEQKGGYVAKFMGDGVLAYFGWPRAQEDAAERSVSAGLNLVAAVARLRGPNAHFLQARVGIASGNVVIGDIIGHGAAKEETIVGDTPHLAARLQSAAEPGAVIISESTHLLIGTLFDCESAGVLSLKGFSDPMPAWRVLGETPGGRRFATARALRSGFIGRERELTALLDDWRAAREGQGSAAMVSGEAGIGKSRLIDALRAAEAGSAHSIVLQCSAFHATNALYPVGAMIEQSLGFAPDEPDAQRRNRLRQFFAQAPDPQTLVPLVSELLSLPGAVHELRLSPPQRKAALIGGLAGWIEETAHKQPVMFIVEDAHWSDATTIELITRLISRVTHHRIQIVVTARPDFASPWTSRAHVRHVALDRLSTAECEKIIHAILSEQMLNRDVIDRIVQKSDGNPLFLQELSLGIAAVGMNAQSIPDTLQDSLMARLDQLGDAKAVAQLASVLGRKFARPLLALVANMPAAALDAELAGLVAAELIYPTGRGNDGHFEFKHALLRDAAYESLLLSRRRQLHSDVATALEKHFPEVAVSEPELLAHHFAQAERTAEAAVYYERTGDRAIARSAYPEAIESFRAAEAQLQRLPQERARQKQELSLALKLGTAASVVHGPNHPDAGNAYAQAAGLASKLDDPCALFQATWGQWFHANIGRDLDAALDYAQQLIAVSERTGDEDQRLEALHCRWSTGFFRGDHAAASADAARGALQYRAERHHHLSGVYGGHDPGVCALGAGGVSTILTGHPADGLKLAEQGVALAESLAHPHSMAHAGMQAASGYVMAGQLDMVRRHAACTLALAEKYNFTPYRLVMSYFLSWVDDVEASSDESLLRLESQAPQARGAIPYSILVSALLGGQLIRTGKPDQALAVADTMVSALKSPDLGLCLPELHRMRADALWALDRKDEAAAANDRALQLARKQQARLHELRIQSSRVRMAAPDAMQALAALVALWPAGQDCRDLQDARTLLG